MTVAAASQTIYYLETKLAIGKEDTAFAKVALNDLQNFLVTFKDNPGRRLVSLFVGVILGIVIATFFGLDLFQAALQVPQSSIKYPQLDIVLTGCVIGLGSNPTHEVIRAIQEYKKNKKADNLQTTN